MEKTKTFTLSQTRQICQWFNDFRTERIKSIPIKIQWQLLQIIKNFEPKVKDYETFENDILSDFQRDYTTEKKAVKKEEDNKLLWIIKDEFLQEYQEKLLKIQDEEFAPLLKEKYTYTFNAIDINNFLETIQDNTKITLDDLEMLDLINN